MIVPIIAPFVCCLSRFRKNSLLSLGSDGTGIGTGTGIIGTGAGVAVGMLFNYNSGFDLKKIFFFFRNYFGHESENYK